MSNNVVSQSYKKGAYIVVEGERSEGTFFVIQSGIVRLNKTMTTPEISSQKMESGDFFEIESALTGRNRLFTAVATTDCEILVIPRNMFDTLIQKRPSLVQKIILQFSQKTRKLDQTLAKISLEEHEGAPSKFLLKIAQYYHSRDMYQPAEFALHHYLKTITHSKDKEEAENLSQQIKEVSKEDHASTFEIPKDEITRKVRAGHMIFAEGMGGQRLFFIQSGAVQICKMANNTEITLAILNKGDLFGEMALLEKKPRSASAIAHKDCSLLVITNENFPLIVQRQPKLITRITTVLAERIWFVYRQIGNVILPKGEERLYDALLLFMERQGVTAEKTKHSIEIKMSVQDLIHHTGLDNKIGQKLVKTFIKESIIDVKSDVTVIISPQYVANRATNFRSLYERTVANKTKGS